MSGVSSRVNLKQEIHNSIFSLGLQPEEYRTISKRLDMRNRGMAIRASLIVAIGCYIAMIVRVIFPFFDINLDIYLYVALGSTVIFLLLTKRPKRKRDIMLLAYGELAVMFTGGIALSVQSGHGALPATAIVVVLCMMPLFICDIAVRMVPFTVFFAMLSLHFSFIAKQRNIFWMDAGNITIFMILSVILYAMITNYTANEILSRVRIIQMQEKMIDSMANIIEDRDEATGGHVYRTAAYCRLLLQKMKGNEKYADALTQEYMYNIYRAAPLHDLGKIKISDLILNKPGKLTDEEFTVMKKHSEYGAELINQNIREVEDPNYCECAYNIALHHHERYDGTGYPSGLKGEEIPLEARVMALSDVYDALTSKRPYKQPFSKEKALEILCDGKGTQFDPEMTDLFVEAMRNQKETFEQIISDTEKTIASA